jgi:integrase
MHDATLSTYEGLRRAYESYMRRRGCALSTLETYGYYFDAFGAWLGDKSPADVSTLVDIEAWFDAWEARFRAKWGRAPSQNTTRNHQIALSSFYDFLFKREYVQANPLAKLDRTPAGKPKIGDWLSVEELNKLLDAPVSPQERIIVAVYGWTAARSADIAKGVTQGDVDFTPSHVFPNGRIVIRESKTEAGRRIVPILAELRIELERWFEHLKGVGLRDDNLPLLVTRNRTPMHHQFLWKVLKRVAARAGVRVRDTPDRWGENLSSVTLHTLRRTLAMHLLNGLNGRPPVRVEVVKALCGHPLSHRVGVTAGLVRRLPAGMEVEPDAEDERGEGHVPAA